MVPWRKRHTEFDAELRHLAEADTLAFGGVGIAGTLLPVTRSYTTLQEALRLHGGRLRQPLERLVGKATPAGRVYAAELLTRIDAAAGHEAWRRLARQTDEVKTFAGCVMGSTTVGDYAIDRLGRSGGVDRP